VNKLKGADNEVQPLVTGLPTTARALHFSVEDYWYEGEGINQKGQTE